MIPGDRYSPRRPGAIRTRSRRPGGLSGLLLARWRQTLALAALLLIAVSCLPGVFRPTASSQPQATPTAPAVDSVPATPPEATARPAQAQSVSSPTPDTVRPLMGQVMPKPGAIAPPPARRPGSPDPMPSTDRFIVMDGASGAILFERNAYEPVSPASLTKIMTAIIGIERGRLDDTPKLDVNARDFSDSTVMGLEPWFHVTLEDLLYGLMLPSGNDAAVAIARYVAGDEKAFAGLMNEKAAWLGLKSTHFSNPHGLDAPDHYSSPYDMAVMARYGMQYPAFQKLAAAKSYAIRRDNIAYWIENLNPILGTYPGADGVKIGYTDTSGRSIVASATRNGHRVFVAFMRSTAGTGPDATHLLDWAFAYHTWP